jgi:predicted nucleic acid-binding protein
VIVYLESSALLSVHLREPARHEEVVKVILEAEGTYTSPLSLVEVRSGLARARFKDNPPRLTAAGYARALTEFNADWYRHLQVAITDEVLERAALLTESHRIRAYDAVHLAAVLRVRDTAVDSVLISTWDRELAAAASAEGIALAHEVTT